MKTERLLAILLAAAATAGAFWALTQARSAFDRPPERGAPASTVVPPQFPAGTPFAQPPMPSVQTGGRLGQQDLEESSR